MIIPAHFKLKVLIIQFLSYSRFGDARYVVNKSVEIDIISKMNKYFGELINPILKKLKSFNAKVIIID